jgi:hypothetical protein
MRPSQIADIISMTKSGHSDGSRKNENAHTLKNIHSDYFFRSIMHIAYLLDVTKVNPTQTR